MLSHGSPYPITIRARARVRVRIGLQAYSVRGQHSALRRLPCPPLPAYSDGGASRKENGVLNSERKEKEKKKKKNKNVNEKEKGKGEEKGDERPRKIKFEGKHI